MYLLIGLAIVAVSVFTGYTLSHGEWSVLFQPAEFIIILGCALGAFFGSQTKYTFGLIVKSLKHLFADPGSSKSRYLETLTLLYALFSKMHREGVISIESDVEKPESSPIFSKYPNVSKDTRLVNFIGDTLRVYLTTGDPADIDSLMDVDIDTMREEGLLPAHAVSHMAESLPGMGIVACVLGVVLAMGKINEPPEILGHYIGAALVGTFFGILCCYGLFGPMGAKLENFVSEEHFYYHSIKEAVAAAIRGSTPLIAVEYGRRAIPYPFRPNFAEMEEKLKNG
ncbi:flagellar motor stator protein MotA [uncultured Desulfovibrio sp.]|jgi:flagellar motor stator protein MotA|uniref:flagellar motor stator protein MotA n=2 Tax=uncultured Desulfovibrio sp. TaxID=167968 RepID=UPI002601A7B8|nr:flagellar motor stator protein MotA [uncultured Desulfovibrio sp.]